MCKPKRGGAETPSLPPSLESGGPSAPCLPPFLRLCSSNQSALSTSVADSLIPGTVMKAHISGTAVNLVGPSTHVLPVSKSRVAGWLHYNVLPFLLCVAINLRCRL